MGIEFTIWGLGGAVATALLLTVIKKVWLDANGEPVIQDRWAVVASIAIGVALSFAAAASAAYPLVGDALDMIGAGILAGLTACGLYSGVKKR